MVSAGSAIDIAAQFMGPHGGALALAFGAGCAATYAFLLTTSMKSVVTQLTESKATLKAAEEKCDDICRTKDARIRELEHLLMFETLGNNRQRSQLAISEQSLGPQLLDQYEKGHVKPGELPDPQPKEPGDA